MLDSSQALCQATAWGSDEAYSAIEHLARTLAPRNWECCNLAMLTACFDASGSDHDQITLVTAGFLSSAKDWSSFDNEWRARLAQDGISYFHMVEFAQSFGEFKGWRDQEERRRSLLSDLIDIIFGHAYRKFGSGILNERYNTHISEGNKERFKVNAYCLTSLFSVGSVDNWAFRERIRSPIEVVFEDGDHGKGTLQKYLSSRKPDPIFRPKKDVIRPDGVVIPAFTPLQAADLLAYEIFLGIKNWETGGDHPPRYGIGRFYDMPGEIKYSSVKDLDNLDGMLRAIDFLVPLPSDEK